jgi:transcriptional regulator GlxA family with amidase domain
VRCQYVRGNPRQRLPAIDCCLHLFRGQLGTEVLPRVLRTLLVGSTSTRQPLTSLFPTCVRVRLHVHLYL